MAQNPVCVYDFTLSHEKIMEHERIRLALKKWAKKWTFQLEKADSGYLHWQGRLSLIKKRRQNEIQKLMQEDLPSIHLSITSTEGSKSFSYAMKDDTWVGEHRYADTDPYIPRQVREIEKLHPWQQAIIDSLKVWDTRHINVLIDKGGGIGKTTLVSYIRAYKLGRPIPVMETMKDYLRAVCDMPDSRAYIIDMPRAVSKENLDSMYGAIETIKGGYAYDERHHWKEKTFDCPNIWVTTNAEPNFRLLTSDRWKLWQVKDNELVEYRL